jgi:two-component system OmpR family response regulator
MSALPRLLVVDDDPGLRDLVGSYLASHGFAVEGAADAREMDAKLAAGAPFDLLVLDQMLPGEDGLSIARRLSGTGMPIIMLSAMGADTDRIVGLEVGADDYLAKPCNPRELLARVRAVLRRSHAVPEPTEAVGVVVEFAGWRLDILRREIRSPEGVLVSLTDGEFALLRAFVEHPQRVLSRDQLLELARGPKSDSYDRAIDVQVSRLRRKLEHVGGRTAADLIRTVRNEGYMLAARVVRH